MGIIRRKITLIGLYVRRRVNALFDSGSSASLVHEDLARDVGTIDELQEPKKFEAATGTFVVAHEVLFRVVYRCEPTWIPTYVVPGLTEEFILGADALQKLGVVLDLPRHRVRMLR
jgi:hypothetical protein